MLSNLIASRSTHRGIGDACCGDQPSATEYGLGHISGSSDIRGGSDGVEEGPVGFSGVEQRPDPVVGESSEPEAGAFDASGQVVDRTAGGLRIVVGIAVGG